MKRSLRDVCPVCRVYDPSWLVHFRACPAWTPAKQTVGAVAAFYRKLGVCIREVT